MRYELESALLELVKEITRWLKNQNNKQQARDMGPQR